MQHQTTPSGPCPVPPELLAAAALWYRGGYTTKAPGGYVREYNPFHPAGSRRGMVMQHRLVVERRIGRLLTPTEKVHHRDGDRAHNVDSNLELMASQSEHMILDHRERRTERYLRDPGLVARVLAAAKDPSHTMGQLADVSPHTIRRICLDHKVEWKSGPALTEAQVKRTLRGRTTAQAAELLGVHQQTLRNHFDHLLDKRRSPGFFDEHKAEILRIARDQSMAAAARRFETHRAVIRKVIQRWSELDATGADVARQVLCARSRKALSKG